MNDKQTCLVIITLVIGLFLGFKLGQNDRFDPRVPTDCSGAWELLTAQKTMTETARSETLTCKADRDRIIYFLNGGMGRSE